MGYSFVFANLKHKPVIYQYLASFKKIRNDRDDRCG